MSRVGARGTQDTHSLAHDVRLKVWQTEVALGLMQYDGKIHAGACDVGKSLAVYELLVSKAEGSRVSKDIWVCKLCQNESLS
jgi:hypothetical protein